MALVPVRVRFDPVVAAMGSTGAGFWRVARRKIGDARHREHRAADQNCQQGIHGAKG